VRAGVLLAAVLVAGCAPAAPEVRLTAASEYGRHAAVQGKVDLYVANRGTAPVEVVGYQVRHPMFELVPATERASTLPPDGQELITPVAFGAPRCGITSACAAEAVEAVAAVSLGPPYVRDGDVVRTVLRLERRSPGAVVVPVVVTATRCDRHALVESKTAFTFPYLAAVDGGEPARLSVTARPEGRAVLQALLDDTCGTGQ
jgi:hypothetical protein